MDEEFGTSTGVNILAIEKEPMRFLVAMLTKAVEFHLHCRFGAPIPHRISRHFVKITGEEVDFNQWVVVLNYDADDFGFRFKREMNEFPMVLQNKSDGSTKVGFIKNKIINK